MQDTHEFDAASLADVEAYLAANCNDGQCWVASVVFGRCFLYGYRRPSAIPYNLYGRTYQFKYRYWRAGAWHEFPRSAQIRYQNSCVGRDS